MRAYSFLPVCGALLLAVLPPSSGAQEAKAPQTTALAAGAAEDSARIRALFADPPREYSSGPLWVWNDRLTERQIVFTMEQLAGQGVRQVWVHPRPGLMTPYLSGEWFQLWKVALRAAERLDMNVWIYDENSYPSGFAGGLVPEAMPQARGQGLHFEERKSIAGLQCDPELVFELEKELSLVGAIRMAPRSGWYGGFFYVDLLRPGVVGKFLEITMGAYEREIGEHFGVRVPGVFTDEPHLAPAGGLHWSDHLPGAFRKRWGYDLKAHLPSLVRPVGDWRRVRHNYYRLLLEEFIERWSKPYFEYCERHGLEFTGHYWEHGWPDASHGGDNMAMYAWHQRPAIDILMNLYSEGVHAQFGNARSVRELASVANQLGRRRTLCETYGASGWDLRFEDMKRIADWLYALGVNTLNEHLSYVTIRGARKRDHPLSFSYHEPWWGSYHLLERYLTRLSLALSAGEQLSSILLIEPTTSAWMYQQDPSGREHLNRLGADFQDLVNALERAQIEYDIGCEDIMGRRGSVDGPRLVVGRRSYDIVVLPPHTENLDAPAMALLEVYARNGGQLISCASPPARVDGALSARGAALAESSGWSRVAPEALPATLAGLAKGSFEIQRAAGDRGILFHHRRQFEDGELLFLVNTSIDSPSTGKIRSRYSAVEWWDLEEGTISSPARCGSWFDFELPPCGSRLFFFRSWKMGMADGIESRGTKRTLPGGPIEIQRLEPNVLTLDFVDITAGGETKKGIYFYEASRFAFQKNGMERNPWDSAVQPHDSLIRRTFPPQSGFEASYRFRIEGEIPRPLHIVIERPDLYSITCNGEAVEAIEGAWWLDKSFGRIDISACVRPGENVVTIVASPFTIYHELEPAYLLGDFYLEPVQSGFLVKPPRPLALGRIDAHTTTPDGSMWLSNGIGFRRDLRDDGQPFVVFDLGSSVRLAAVRIWNYNEVNLTARGVHRFRISTSLSGEPHTYTHSLGTFELDQARSSSTGPNEEPRFPVTLRLDGTIARFVRFDILSNHHGTRYPTEDGSLDNAFVGLSEVQLFKAGAGGKLERLHDVSIAAVSSELVRGFDRRADHLVDSSGLTASGWNTQGHPFYAAQVAYARSYDIADATGRFFLHLPSWYGSVAEVRVNGRLAGSIWHRPWRLELGSSITKGANRIEVLVTGTLKNTLGPHHAGPVVGKAWPGMFQQAPRQGPPPGHSYHTLGYGLTRPFELVREKR